MIYFITSVLILTLIRQYFQFKKSNLAKFSKSQNLSLISVLGSGGHTNEMLRLIQNFPVDQSKLKVTFLIAETDVHSEDKISTAIKQNLVYDIFKIPRSREVGQSYVTSIFTTIKACLHSWRVTNSINPDILLINGPGTCIPILLLSYVSAFMKTKKFHVIFVESFCRVQSLSLTGLIIYHLGLYDQFFVQWPRLKQKYQKCEYVGRIL